MLTFREQILLAKAEEALAELELQAALKQFAIAKKEREEQGWENLANVVTGELRWQ